jgi:hypothetical protein
VVQFENLCNEKATAANWMSQDDLGQVTSAIEGGMTCAHCVTAYPKLLVIAFRLVSIALPGAG